MKISCQFSEACTPDYWHGSDQCHLAVNVDKKTSYKSLRKALRKEIEWGQVMGNCDLSRILSADYVKESEVEYAEKATRAVYAAINRDVVPSVKHAKLPFKHLESDNDQVYAFFFLSLN